MNRRTLLKGLVAAALLPAKALAGMLAPQQRKIAQELDNPLSCTNPDEIEWGLVVKPETRSFEGCMQRLEQRRREEWQRMEDSLWESPKERTPYGIPYWVIKKD